MIKNLLLSGFKNFNHQYQLIKKSEKVIVAVSGGIDSMVVLDLLSHVKDDWKLDLVVAHFNHKLREKESDDDEFFVLKKSDELGYTCYVERADTKAVASERKSSIQETARDLRLEFFTNLRRSLGFQKIATGHNANDNAETILFNVFRGTGVEGLSGIPIYRPDLNIVRPLLFATRDQIEEYAKENNIQYREDSSNLMKNYARNFLRNSIIPQICENINPNLIATLQRTGELFDALTIFIKNESSKIFLDLLLKKDPDQVIIDLNKFQTQPLFFQEFILLQTAREFTGLEIDFAIVKTMLNISRSSTGSTCNIKKNIILYRDRNSLVFRRITPIVPFCYFIDTNKQYEFQEFNFKSETVTKEDFSRDTKIEFIDADLIENKLILRNWRHGDWFIPLGMQAKKKVSDFFIEQKIPIYEKQKIPILECAGNIIWICGMRIDDRYKITPNTKNILKLEYVPHHASS